MALTIEEKNKMLEMLANPVQGQAVQGGRAPMYGMIRIETLVEYRGKTDEMIKAELALYDIKKKEAIEKQLVLINENKSKMEAELAKLA